MGMLGASSARVHGGAWNDQPGVVLVFVVAVALVATHFVGTFTMLPNMEHPGNGSPWAPHSDALGPWLEGGLSRLFGMPPPFYLYRPTVGVFWGSILAATGRIQWIPISFLLFLLAACSTVVAFARDRPLRAALAVMAAFAAMRFGVTWLTLNFDIDIAALAFTVSGVLLVLWDRTPGASTALLAGCACMGVAAAIRGPFMLAGPLVIAIRIFLIGRGSRIVLLACAAVFLAPIVTDVALQRHFGTINNGLRSLFCVYTDPTHGWSPACKVVYSQLKLDPGEVARRFVAFRLSPVGFDALFHDLAWRVSWDLRLMHSPATYAILLGIGALESTYPGPGPRRVTPFVKALFLVMTLAGVARFEQVFGWLASLWALLALVVAVMERNWRAFLCLTAYVAGILFLALLGLIIHDRLVHTFYFTLVLGIALLMLDGPRERVPPQIASGAARTALATATAAWVLFLYFGAAFFPSAMRETYLREVKGRPNAAIKVGDEPALDRSLYYSGTRNLVYTRHDGLPIGGVRTYGSFATGATGNDSFVRPNSFVAR